MSAEQFHVAVNARFLLDNRLEGLGRYSHEILSRLTRRHPEARFTFFFDRPFSKVFVYSPNVTPLVLAPQARHPLLWKLWFDWSVRRKLKQMKPHVFYSPDGFLCNRTEVPQVPVIHDLAFEHYPEDTMRSHARFYRRYFPRYAGIAAHILTVSEFSKQDIAERYQIAPAKITVTGNAAAAHFKRLEESESDKTKQQFTGGAPFFHYTGAIQPRKNLENVFAAFAAFRQSAGTDVRLLIVGRKAWKFDSIEKAWQDSPVKDFIHFTGYVSDEILNGIYNASLGLVYVPWFEGFGIPVVEAMQCGCPVIASDRSSLPGVAGDAALLVPPGDPSRIAEAMRLLLESPETAQRLSAAGRERAKAFSWDHFADITWKVLREAGTKI